MDMGDIPADDDGGEPENLMHRGCQLGDAWASFNIDKDSCERADQLLEALRILVRGTKITTTSDVPLDCLSCRADVSIQHIAGELAEQADAYRLSAELRCALFCIADGGCLDELPADLRKQWDDLLDLKGPSDPEPWVADGEA